MAEPQPDQRDLEAGTAALLFGGSGGGDPQRQDYDATMARITANSGPGAALPTFEQFKAHRVPDSGGGGDNVVPFPQKGGGATGPALGLPPEADQLYHVIRTHEGTAEGSG